MLMRIVLLCHQVLKRTLGFDDPAGKDGSEFQRVLDDIKMRLNNLSIEHNKTAVTTYLT